MFTGIIEETGQVKAFRRSAQGGRVVVATDRIAPALRSGESIAVNGVCLTVVESRGGAFTSDLSSETLARTSLAQVREGTRVNLERPLATGDRLGGHFVLGHVDGIGRLVSLAPDGDGCTLRFQYPKELERYLVFKGSIAVDGISLTIASLAEQTFAVAIIPHTLEVTNLRDLRPGDAVNLETDILGKYFDRFFQLGLIGEKTARLTPEYLEELGFLTK